MTDNRHLRNAILYYGGFASRAGGAFMHTTTLSEGLRARGWTTSTVTLDRLPLLLRYLPHVVERLVNRLSAPLGFHYKGIVTRMLYKHLVRRRPTDLLVFEDIYLAWNSANPSITVLHAVWSDNLQAFAPTQEGVNRLKRKEIATINRIDHPVVTVSRPYRDYLQRDHFGGVGTIALEVVELGLDIDGERLRAGPDRADRGQSLVYCGALEARKNVSFMLEVFARIQAADPAATLTIVGDGPEQDALAAHVGRHGLNVTFLGKLPHERVLEELTRHNIYIHTATKESFSFALLEAKLAGLTTCALAGLEVPEEFIDIGFEAFDAADWSSRILAIRRRPDMHDFPDYSVGRMTDHTLSLVSMT
jgi:glycosyltransferase involved in cell wall biosynthesis